MNSMKTTNAAGKVLVPLAVIAIAALFIGGAYAYSATYSDNFGQQDIEAVYVTVSADHSNIHYGQKTNDETSEVEKYDVDVIYDTFTDGTGSYYKLTADSKYSSNSALVGNVVGNKVTFTGAIDGITIEAHGDKSYVTLKAEIDSIKNGAIYLEDNTPSNKCTATYKLQKLKEKTTETSKLITIGSKDYVADGAAENISGTSEICIEPGADKKVFYALTVEIVVDQLGTDVQKTIGKDNYYSQNEGNHVNNLYVKELAITYTATATQATPTP
ncbi:MAG: hypothetical protein MJZ38_00840 [archaeon]|nr:hypothetical protein [archaeon]